MPSSQSKKNSNDKNSDPTSEKQKNESENEDKNSEEKMEQKDKETPESDSGKEKVDEAERAEEKKPKEFTKEDILKILKSFSGVGQIIAERIHDAGFDTRERLLAMTADDLSKIRGIGKSMAENIVNGLEKAVKDFEAPPKEEKKKPEQGITDKALGFIKGTFGKITGFFKGKLPKPKSTSSGSSETARTKVEPEKNEEGKTIESEVKEPKADEQYPEVGVPEEKVEEVQAQEPVTIEGSESETKEERAESKDESLELGSELPPEQEAEETPKLEQVSKPEFEPQKKIEPEKEPGPVISLTDASGLLKWFEITPNLRVETGKLIFKAGYNNLEELKEAVVEDLILIKGITKQEATDIYHELKKLS